MMLTGIGTRLVAVGFSLVFMVGAAVAQPTFTKTFSPDTIGPGSTTRLTFDIFNGTGSPVTDLAFVDTLPAAVTLANPVIVENGCGGMVSAPAGGSTISLSDGLLGVGASCSIVVSVTSSTAATHTNTTGDLTSSAGNSGTATDDLTVANDRPGFSKSFAPGAVSLGGRSTLTFTIDNTANASNMVSLTFADTLPGSLEIASPANAATTCSGGAIVADPGTQFIQYSPVFPGDATVAAGASCTVVVDVVAVGVGTAENLSGNLTSTQFGSPLDSGLATASVVITSSQLQLTKRFTDDPVRPGGMVNLEFSIRNFNRSEPATAISFTDDLDATLSGLIATGLPQSNVCGAGSMLSGTSTLSLTGASLPAEGVCTFSVTLQVPGGATAGSYPNTTSSINGTVGGAMIIGSPATDTLFVNDAPVLTKTFLANPVGGGSTVTTEFTITNSSSTSAATDINFTDNISMFITSASVSAVPPAGFCGGGSSAFTTTVSGDLVLFVMGGNLAAGGSCTFTVDITLPAGIPAGDFLNRTSPVNGTVDGTVQQGAPATATLTVVAGPTLMKEFTDDPVLPGDTVTLEFTLEHDAMAAGDATAITFSDNLDATLSGLAATGLPVNDVCGAGSQLSGTSVITLTGGNLMPGDTCVFAVTLNVPAAANPGQFLNQTSDVTADVSGVSTVGTGASDTLTVAGLMLMKEFIDDPLIAGDTGVLRFTLDNSQGTQDATGIFFTDNLSATLPGLTAVAPLPANPCGAGSSITGTNFLLFAGGNLLAGESCTFDVNVMVPGGAADGTYGNVTSNVSATIGGSVVSLPPAADDLVVQSELLALSKTFIDDPVSPGGTATLQFSIDNLSTTDTITMIGLTDDLDATLTGLAATGAGAMDVCGGGSSLSGTNVVTLADGSLAPGANCTFNVTVIVPGGASAGSYPNTTSDVTGNVGGLNVTGAPATDNLDIRTVTLTKSFDGPTAAGQTALLTFMIENEDAGAGISNLSFTDDLNAALSGLVATGLPQNDVCGTGSTLSGTSFLNFSGGNLGPSASCSFAVTVQVPAGAAPGSYLNQTSALFESGLVVAAPGMATLAIEPPPTFDKAFGPASIAAGGVSTLTFTIDNSGSAIAANALDFTDNLPAGLLVAAPASGSATCSGGTLTAVSGTGTISYTGGSLAAGSVCSVSVDVTGAAAGDYVNTSGDLTSTSGNSGPATDTLRINPQPGFAKLFNPDAIPGNGISTLTFTIDNSGSTVSATGLSFVDNLPGTVVVATSPNESATCTGGTITAAAGTGVISYVGGTVAAGATCTVQADVVGPTPGTFVNTSGNLTSSLGDSGTATDTLTVATPPDFAKSFAPDTIVIGGISTLNFTIDNTANTLNAMNGFFNDTLPTGVTVASPTNLTNGCAGSITANPGSSNISVSAITVAAGTTCLISVDVTGSTPGDQVNVTTNLMTSLGNSGQASDTLTVNPPPAFAKVFNPDAVGVNGVSTLVFTIDNSGATFAADNLDFTDNLPTGLQVAATPAASTTCVGGTLSATSGSGTISYSGGMVASGGTCTVSVDVTPTGSGSFVNVTGDLTSTLGNSGTATDTLGADPAPLFAKSFAPDTIATGEVSTLTFTIDNVSSVTAATGMAFTDNLPAAVAVAANPAVINGCGGSVSATAGSSSISLASGNVSAGNICTISVNVTSSTPGTHVNTSGDLTSSLGNSGPAMATLLVDPPPAFAKSFAPASIGSGSNSVLTFMIDNSGGAQAATGLSFSDSLPGSLVIANPANAVDGCAGALTATSGSGSIDYSGGSLGAGMNCSISVEVTTANAGTYDNLSGDLTSSLGNSGMAAATLTVTLNAPPFAKAFAPATIQTGAVSTLTLSIDNTSNGDDVGNLAFVDNLPSGLVVAPVPNDSNSCGGTLSVTSGAITLSGGTVSASSSCMVSVDVTADTDGNYVNTTGDLMSDAGNSGPATAALAVDDLAPVFSKAFAPSSIQTGAVSTLSFTVDNMAGLVTISDLAFVDDLPAGLVVAPAPNTSSTCGGTLDATGGTITLSGGTVSAGNVCAISVDVTSSASGSYVNTSGGLTSDAGNSGVAMATLVVNDLPPTFSKAFDPANIQAGAVSSLTLNIDNSAGLVAISDLAFTDNLPAGLVVAPTPNTTNTCGGTVSATGGAITLTGGTVAAGNSCAVAVDVTADTAGSYTNTTGDLTSDAGNSGSATDTITVNDLAPGFSKSFTPATIQAGSTSTLAFAIDNSAGLVTVSDLAFVDNLPSGLSIATTPAVANDCGGTLTANAGETTITLSGGTVAAGATCNIQVDVTAPASGSYVNTTGALMSDAGQGAMATATLTVNGLEPGFSKVFSPAEIQNGGISTLTFTIDNQSGLVAAGDLAFTDPLPAAVTIASVPNASSNCNGGVITAPAGGTTISYSGGSVAAGGTCTVQVDVTSSTNGSYVNTSGDLTSDAGNSGSATATLTVGDVMLAFSKTFPDSPVAAGSPIQLQFDITNPDSVLTATDIEFTDDLDAMIEGARLVSAPANPCGPASQITGTDVLTFSGGELGPGDSCTFMVTLSVPSLASGVFTNVTSPISATVGGTPIIGGPADTASAQLVIQAGAVAVPSLDRFGMILMILLMGGLAMRSTARIRARS